MSESEEESSGCADWPVSSEWLENLLSSVHEDDSVTVLDYTVRPGCDASESVLSDILAVALDYRLASSPGETHSKNIIVKLLPRDPFSRFFVTEAQFDLREIKFYTQVVPELEQFQTKWLPAPCKPHQLPIPKCYHARYTAPSLGTNSSPVAGESVLVLDNMKARGFVGAEFSAGLSLRQTESALRAVACLHALSLALKIKEGRPLAERYPFLFQTAKATDSYQQLVERGLPQLARFLERRPGLEPILKALLALRPNTKEVIAALLAPEEPLALITHTDFWCNNLLFREPSEEGHGEECECAVLDWQMVTYSRPTNDIALLLISSVPTDLRRQHSTALLDGYWAAFTGAAGTLGVDVEGALGYNRERLGQDYRRSQLLALLLCIGSVDVALGDPLTEQRLLDVLHDLHEDGVLTPDTAQ